MPQIQTIGDIPRYKDLGKRTLKKYMSFGIKWLDPELRENKWLQTGEPLYGDDWEDVEWIEQCPDDHTKQITVKGFWSEKRQEFIRPARDPSRVLEFTASMGVRDRDKEILDVKGWRTKNFMLNPAITWVHRSDELLIGNAVRVQKDVENDKLRIWPEFVPRELYDWADTVFRNYKAGWMKAGSVSFDPIKWDLGDIEKVMAGDPDEPLVHFHKQDLIEFAMCAIGALPQALANFEKQHGTGYKKKFYGGYDPEDYPPEDGQTCFRDAMGDCKDLSITKGTIIDDPPGDYKWYKWTRSEAAKWCKDNDYKAIGDRKEKNFWHFSLTPKERYSEFKTKWLGEGKKPSGFDLKDPSGRPVLLGLGKLKGKTEWEEHNLEFYHGEEELAKKTGKEITLETVSADIESLQFFFAKDVIPRLDRLEKLLSGGENGPDVGRESLEPEPSDEKTGSRKATKRIKKMQGAIDDLFGRDEARQAHPLAAFKDVLPRKREEVKSNGR